MALFDVFKGRENKKGTVLKIRSVGEGYYDDFTDTCELHINGFEKNGYTLEPEKDINADHDYVILFENLDSEDLQPVGVGTLLKGKNAGLIKLSWDFYGVSDIYINLSEFSDSCEAAA